jgi:cellulose synthase operon protein C
MATVHAVAVFAELIKEFPGSTAVITGAADAELRTALRSADSAPFRARNSFRAAQHGYERAAALGAKDESAPGLARALIGLGEPAQTAKILRGRIADSSTPGPLLELLVVAEEAAHDFGRAESDARRLAGLGSRAFPDGPALYPVGSFPLGSAPPTPPTPLSVGADRFAPLTVRFHGRGLGGGSVEDLSFIPTYRSVRSVTGSEPECGDWTWRRDAVLAGHAREALTGWPTSTQETALNRACFSASSYGFSGASDYATFYALVQAEAGIRAPMGRYVAKQLADDRQNLWRWAGDMRKAERVIRAWIKADPNDPLAELRLGEVEYLQRRYDAAAAHFGTAARRTRDADWRNDLGVDEALLDRGAALRAAGRAAEATAVLRDVESDAARGLSYHGEYAYRFATVVYYARVQMADQERESGALHDAVENDVAAQEVLRPLEDATGQRPEALYNNSALAHLGLGQLDAARSAVGKALAIDPANPAFLMTAGYIADLAGQTKSAIDYDSSALASDSGAYPAANDLGVELARQHHDAAAAEALRKAVGARPDYALGWFNLGVLMRGWDRFTCSPPKAPWDERLPWTQPCATEPGG